LSLRGSTFLLKVFVLCSFCVSSVARVESCGGLAVVPRAYLICLCLPRIPFPRTQRHSPAAKASSKKSQDRPRLGGSLGGAPARSMAPFQGLPPPGNVASSNATWPSEIIFRRRVQLPLPQIANSTFSPFFLVIFCVSCLPSEVGTDRIRYSHLFPPLSPPSRCPSGHDRISPQPPRSLSGPLSFEGAPMSCR